LDLPSFPTRRSSDLLTGLDSLAPGLDAKRLELLKQLLPGITHLAVLGNPLDNAMRLHLEWIQSAAAALGLNIRVFEVRQPTDLRSEEHTSELQSRGH